MALIPFHRIPVRIGSKPSPRLRSASYKLRVEALGERIAPAIFNVSPAVADGAAGSLRAALVSAQQLAEHSDIILAAGTFHLSLGALQIVGGDLWIGAANGTQATVDQDTSNESVFDIVDGTVVFQRLAITGGQATGDGGGVNIRGGTVTISDCYIFGNTASSDGGGISNLGALTVQNSNISNNSAGHNGGGIENRAGVPLSILNCTISNNTAGNGGGGVGGENTVGPTIILRGSTISGNSARAGGGVSVGQPMLIEGCLISNNIATDLFGGGVNAGPAMTIRNTTIIGNSAGSVGGGVANDGNLTMTSCTVTDNTAATGGGIAHGDISRQPDGISVTNSTIFGNSSGNGADVHSAYSVNTSYSLIGDTIGFTESNGAGNLAPGTSPNLGPLQDNGGPTLTMAPQSGSPLINRGSNALVPADLTTDQRGASYPRIFGSAVDIGSFEVQPRLVPSIPSVSSATFIEDDPPVAIDPGIRVIGGPGSNLLGATVQIGNYFRGQDVLGYTLQGGISASFDTITGVLTFSGSATVTDYQAVLRSLTYLNTSEQPVELVRIVTLSVNNGGANDSNSVSYSIYVIAQNDAPEFSADGELSPILQGTISPPGRKVAAIFAGLFDDPDANARLLGVAAVTNAANATTQGKWQYSSDNGSTWFDVGVVADGGTALALSATTRIRFLAVASFSGSPTSLIVRAIDDTYAGLFTSGSTRQTVDASVNGGITAIAATTAGIGTTIFPTGTGGNTPPSLSGVPASANLDEMQTLTFTASASDPDLGQTLAFSLVGAPANATIDPDTGDFSWTPTELQGPDTFVFRVRVTDGFTITEETVTAVVREVNVAPVLTGVPLTQVVLRGDTLTFTPSATDADRVNGLQNTLTYSLVGAPAGAMIDPDSGIFAWTPGGDVIPGEYGFSVRVADDGVPSKSHSQPITVTVVQSGLDGGNLFVAGTSGNDKIEIKPDVDVARLLVKLNGDPIGVYTRSAITGRIVVLGLAGHDRITIWPKLTLKTELIGGLGNDTLKAGAANDILDGGAGNDFLIGGKGDDTYRFVGAWGKDRVAEAANSGADALDFAAIASPLSASWSTSFKVVVGLNTVMGRQADDLIGGGGTDTLTSGNATNVWDLTGLNAGTLNGKAFTGIEHLRGGSRTDTFRLAEGAVISGSIVGGAGANILDYSTFTTAVTVNLALGTATGVTGGISQITGVTGGAGNDLLVGDSGRNTLNGGAGRDVLIGGKGADRLSGGADDDLLLAGQTTLDVDPTGLAAVQAEWTSNFQYLDRLAHLTGVGGGLNGAVVLDGNSVQEDSGKDRLIGGDGRDWFVSGAGDRIFDKLADEIQTVL